jgi:hypothetical protein
MLRLIAQICCGFLNLVSLIDQRPRSGFLMVHLFFMPQMICFLLTLLFVCLASELVLGADFIFAPPVSFLHPFLQLNFNYFSAYSNKHLFGQ